MDRSSSFDLERVKVYICPECGNVIVAYGFVNVECCGKKVVKNEIQKPDERHVIKIDKVEDEYYVTMKHEMTKEHYISFIMAVYDDKYEMVKLYPEGPCEARFKTSGIKGFYYYCNEHGLFKV